MLTTAGWPASLAQAVRAGDLLRMGGSGPALASAQADVTDGAYLITADADADASGNATLAIDPPIVAGGSPADGAALRLAGTRLRARIAAYDLPAVPPGQLFTGMTVDFMEAP